MVIRVIIFGISIFLAAIQGYSQPSHNKLSPEDYFRLNEAEKRLQEHKDTETVLVMKLKQLEHINKSRKKFRAPPLNLDILASRLANKMCKEAALNKYVGHWNLAGEKPYHRYAFAGGVDHISENASGQMTTGQFDNSEESITKRMIEDHNSFMAEKKPNDGHKQTVIDKFHNFVGIGYYASEQEFRYYELYIDRYYEFIDIPSELKEGEKFIFKCSPGDGKYLNLLLAYYEKEPRPMSPRAISSRSYYNDYTDKIAFQVAPWEISSFRKGKWYNIPLKFDKAGLYYIQIYADEKPYKTGTRYSSERKLQASGIVIRVTK